MDPESSVSIFMSSILPKQRSPPIGVLSMYPRAKGVNTSAGPLAVPDTEGMKHSDDEHDYGQNEFSHREQDTA